ncbi:NACHT domain-containing protein [Bradyrhizobium brasilense]|uniref:NACHT domain-containing protein n=1 Tax=Bradyrhizobium brasilense TaxID=1419277 RepID=UPI0014571C7C|nr:NACHT domain-containing protein [Bradyrhizobium brasilense]NLS72515.1 NACHT domain-containing protein [Bradyrhizobium brasilense]
MTYLYEQLSPERFQHFCQALLVTQFPNAQCLPVGQPDGGRDAFVWSMRNNGEEPTELIVFQVKFSREQRKADPEFINSIVESELPKVERLKSKGITRYYLLTNASGSSHLETGSIDRVDAVLSDKLGVPSYCWWRNDLDRRVDAEANIKWSYPEIIRGSDLLQSLFDGMIGEDGRRRDDAIKAYLAAQYEDDREVKFKQVDLTHSLLDLFVDTSLQWTDSDERGTRGFFVQARGYKGETYDYDEERAAASFFLLQSPAGRFCRTVLEGAPGQGKSTITQYICQIHRVRLLDRDRRLIPAEHFDGVVRFPLRVDLRDFASWLAGKNPYASDPNAVRPADSQNSLESFLAFQISQSSGGHAFSVSDISAVARVSHLLIVLDGFDEVADIPTREQIVKEISRGATRLETTSRSLQIIVTSRPAAFAKSPGFSRKDWTHLSLRSMEIAQINEYADKWMRARHLTQQEKADFREVLVQKLDQPHMRDLARNPMQLAILLSLIQTRGLSLPDKRTALYDSYMELFFSREAEKSSVVREHRDLLVDLHQFLAWVIQTEAEEANSKGSITEEQLKNVLRDYLAREGHQTSLVDDLFVGMVERVVALVSRVEGTFEFEVQPLREYFAARHLYETAPYSPPGREKHGTKPERFDVLARNFYWLNVTRFYCGCYSRGELSSLADGLMELAQDESYKFTSYPRLLILMLLSDWVFTQQPLVVSRLTKEVTRDPGFRILLASLWRERSAVSLISPERCGRTELIRESVQVLSCCESLDVIQILATSIRQSSKPAEIESLWLSIRGNLPDNRWLYIGRLLGVLTATDSDKLDTLYEAFGSHLVSEVGLVGRYEFIQSRTSTFSEALEEILDGNGIRMVDHGPGGPSPYIARVAFALEIGSYNNIFTHASPYFSRAVAHGLALRDSFEYSMHNGPKDWQRADDLRDKVSPELLDRCERFLQAFNNAMSTKSSTWSTSLRPWTALVSAGMAEFGMKPIFLDLALLAAGINSKTENGAIGGGITDETVPLCERIRFARLRSGAVNWWREQLERCSDDEQLVFVLTCLLVWGTPRTILMLAETVAVNLDRLSLSQWDRLLARLGRASRNDGFTVDNQLTAKLNKSPLRFCIVFASRLAGEAAERIVLLATRNYDGKDRRILKMSIDAHRAEAQRNPSKWKEALGAIRHGYDRGVTFPPYWGDSNDLPISIARVICSQAAEYPLSLVEAAQNQLTKLIGSTARPPGRTAKVEGWFAPT